MIFDHENGNWKNSEITTAMLKILSSEVESHDVAEIEPAANDDTELVASAKRDFLEQHRQDARHLIISELNRIAANVAENHKAALEIEMAMEDIEEILK